MLGTAQIDGSPVSQDIIDAVNGSGYESASSQAESLSPPIISNEKINTFSQLTAYNNTCVHFSWCVSG